VLKKDKMKFVIFIPSRLIHGSFMWVWSIIQITNVFHTKGKAKSIL